MKSDKNDKINDFIGVIYSSQERMKSGLWLAMNGVEFDFIGRQKCESFRVFGTRAKFLNLLNNKFEGWKIYLSFNTKIGA